MILNISCFTGEFQSDLASQVMEEDKKKQVLGNGLPTETESPVVAKVK